ncbi:thioesterase [Actinocatenispora thailandica]|uniref:Thioesterase n=1 Tax=Actinocatenispora thailandica TaxID=227318 RepID=A0A7R7DMK4_9ACTN|nr:thioesterase family protein [Actinocatenispora thailandica]BCJ34440.1 thioesterase [Actinocatenispora thailandica]
MARFEYECAVRWSDLDAYGHVNNARFLTLYEEARAALMFLTARTEGITSLEAGTVIARHEVDYLRPVDFGEPVRIELWLSEIRNASFRVCYELFDDGRLASRATSVLVPYDLAAGRPRRLSAAEREFLSRWRDA